MSIELSAEQEKQVQDRIDERVCIEKANLLKLMKDHFGEEAYHVFAKADGEEVRILARMRAEELGDNSIEALINELFEASREHGTEYSMTKTDSGYQIKCTKCRTYNIAERLGITEQMYYMNCTADPYIAEGFNPNIGFKRTKTRMHGDEYCDHFYYYKIVSIK
ncbi:MAG: L-2-amino-thiazoline-4-carboxylic acid hydrolase [Oscillospiraceae bacterium]|jgi:predicted ArsR family transcriptional regulator|nr:L-2-amino-thiazoline-4-carboxylic acid hydrolase [Oscillospiraceae bacterium]